MLPFVYRLSSNYISYVAILYRQVLYKNGRAFRGLDGRSPGNEFSQKRVGSGGPGHSGGNSGRSSGQRGETYLSGQDGDNYKARSERTMRLWQEQLDADTKDS